MKFIKLLTVLLVILPFLNASAQHRTIGGNTASMQNSDIGNGSGLKGKKYVSKFKGDFYIFEEFEMVSIVPYKNDIKGLEKVSANINVQENTIEIDFNGQIKVLDAFEVKSLVRLNNAENYVSHMGIINRSLKGFSKVVYSGKSTIYCHYKTIIMEPNFNAALNVGEKDYRILKELSYYVQLDNKLHEIPKSKKEFTKLLASKPATKDFIKKNKINPKKESDLIKAFQYYDGL